MLGESSWCSASSCENSLLSLSRVILISLLKPGNVFLLGVCVYVGFHFCYCYRGHRFRSALRLLILLTTYSFPLSLGEPNILGKELLASP